MRYSLKLLIISIVLLTIGVVMPLAQDTPTITITPESGEVGVGIFEIMVEGLVPDRTYTVEFVYDGLAVFASEEVADDDGVVSFSASSTPDDEAGTYTVQVISNDSIIAATEFELISDSDASSDTTSDLETIGNISITPDSGPISTLHTISLSNLEPDTNYTIEITASRTEEVVYRRVWTSGSDGEINVEVFANEGDTAGQQIVSVFDSEGNLIAQDEFTIEDAPTRNVVTEVTPQIAQAGREFTITVSGLAAFDNVSVQITSANNVLLDTLQARASSEGIAILSFLSDSDIEEGEYSIAVFVDSERMADATLTIGDAPLAQNSTDTSDVQFSIEPEAGPIGSTHIFNVSGLEAEQAVTLTISNDNGDIEYSTTRTADTSGEFSINISSSEDDELGTYPVEISDATTGQVIATAEMIIVDGDVPQSTGTDTTAQTSTPTITANPEAGEIGTTHNITLSGMPAGARIGVTIRAQADDVLAVSSVIQIDDNGDATYEFTSRELNTPGIYNIVALQPSGELASTTITIEGAIATVEPQSGPLGSTHTVSVAGLNPNETITLDVSFGGEVVFSTERTADANGDTSLNLTTDETDELGDYTVTVVRESGNQPSVTLTATGDEEIVDDTDNSTDTTATNPDAEVIEGQLSSGFASITFSGEEGQYVIINVTSDEFDTVATVYDRDFFQIGYNDDSSGTLNSRVGPVLLPYTGDYTLEVSESTYSEDGLDEASFTVRIQPITVSGISFDEPISFTLDESTPAHYYEFTAEAGDSINLSVNSDGSLDTVLTVLYPDGFEFASDDDSGEGFDAELNNLIFDSAGTYILVLSSFDGSSTGEGILTATRNPVKSLDEGDVVVTLNDKAYRDLVVFEGEEGDVITLNLETLSGQVSDLYVYATVDGSQVMYYTTMGVPDNLPLTFVMPMSGEVVVTLEEFGFGEGITFNVSVEKE